MIVRMSPARFPESLRERCGTPGGLRPTTEPPTDTGHPEIEQNGVTIAPRRRSQKSQGGNMLDHVLCNVANSVLANG